MNWFDDTEDRMHQQNTGIAAAAAAAAAIQEVVYTSILWSSVFMPTFPLPSQPVQFRRRIVSL